MPRAKLPRQRLFVCPSCDSNGLETHLRGKLNTQMAEPAYTQYGDDISGLRAAVPESIESRNPGAHQRTGLYR
jgi:hypothetical protein